MPTLLHSGNDGDHDYVVAEYDITSLTNANNEPLTPVADFGFRDVAYGAVVQVENPGSYVYQVDTSNDLYVEGYGGSDPSAGTDVGIVRIKWVGNFGP